MKIPTDPNKKRRGQSLVEMALALPVMLIMISGLIEFGFALNQYLNTLDAAREAARFATDSDPLDRDFRDPADLNLVRPGITNPDCGTTLDFYMQAACIADQTMNPVNFNIATDDVVISVFRILSGTVIGRWPNCEPDPGNDCPFDPPAFPETMGEWHLFGRGDGCGPDGSGNGFDDDGDTYFDDGCGANGAFGASEFCNPLTEDACHPSRITTALVESKLEDDAPDSAVLVVEIFYDYPHVLQLPWITPFVPNPLPLHTYTILPLPAAEPSLTITGTVMQVELDNSRTPLAGVTIIFDNGMIAITDNSGEYVRTGLSSGLVNISVDLSATDCNVSDPVSYAVFLNISNVYDRNFELSDCIDVAATNAQATVEASETQAALTSEFEATGTAIALETEVAGTAAAGVTLTPGETAIPTETATISPTCSEAIVSAALSQVTILSPNPARAQADGGSDIQVLVRVLNECGTSTNMAGLPVALSSSRGDDLIAPGGTNTDGAGEATFAVVSSVMSVWNSASHDFENSTFSANVGGTAIIDTAGGSFVCVGSASGVNTDLDKVSWTLVNDSGIDRRLDQFEVTWSQAFSAARWLSDVSLDGLAIWTGISQSNPTTLSNADWTGAPADRVIAAGATKELVLTYNFSVTGGQTFTLIPKWVNTSGTSLCTSNTVVINR